MAEINLLQNRLKDTTDAGGRQSKAVLAIFAVILAVIVGATVMLFLLNNSLESQIAAAAATNLDLKSKIAVEQKGLGDAKAFQAQLANLRVLLNNHTFISPLLDELSRVTYVKSQYMSFDVAEGGKIHIEGLVNTYVDLGKMLLGLSSSPHFKNVKLLSVVPSNGEISGFIFSVDLNVIPDIFVKK